MKREIISSSDSLDLLLDTMCNAFGGIVLIAILFALLSNEVRESTEVNRVRELNNALVSRRIQQAEIDLNSAMKYEATLMQPLADPAVQGKMERVKQIEALKQTLSAATNQVVATQQQSQTVVSNMSQPASERLQKLNVEANDINRARVAVENQMRATSDNIERLKQRAASMEADIRNNDNRSVVKLRLPKERNQTKSTYAIIIQYNEIFCLRNPDGRESINEYALEIVEMAGGDHKVKPRRGRGINVAGLTRVLGNISRTDHYVVCWVYHDSFKTFNEVKASVIRAGFDYGWNPLTPDDGVVLTSNPVVPPAPQ
jgi:hypothetical protein